MKKITVFLFVLFLLSGCATPKVNAITGNSHQPEAVSISSGESAQAETQTFQNITIQVTYRNPNAGELILPLTIVGIGDDSIWSPGEPSVKLGEELVLASELVEIDLIPSTDGGVSGIAHRLKLRFDLSSLHPDISMGLLEIPYVFSENAENGGEVIKIDGPWVFEIPVKGN